MITIEGQGIGNHFRALNLWAFLTLMAGVLAGCARFVDRDQIAVQPDRTFVLQSGHAVGQTLVARHAGLRGIEIWLAPEQGSYGELQLELWPEPESSTPLRTAWLWISPENIPGFYHLEFASIPNSRGKRYYVALTFSGIGSVRVGAGPWDAYLDGALYADGSPVEAQMAFRLIYDVKWIINDLIIAILNGLFLFFTVVLLYGAPGWVLLRFLMRDEAISWRWGDRAGLAVGVSLALYPVLFLWADLLGLRLGSKWLGLPLISGIILLVDGIRYMKGRQRLLWPKMDGADGILALVLGLAIAVRLLPVRGLEGPMWGDGFQHTVIVQLLLDHGGLFQSWEPYAPIQTFTYHFGFHSAMAILSWATGWSAIRAVLIGGQVLNAMASLTLYPLARRLAGGCAWAGVIAVALPALFWPMPMFYVNWGRYPQLAGQTILPIAVLLTWDMLESQRWSWSRMILVAWVVAGLALTHYRVLAFYGAFLAAWVLLYGWSASSHHFRTRIFRLLTMGVFTIGLIGPWLFRVGTGRLVAVVGEGMSSSSGGDVVLSAWRALNFYMPAWGWVLGGLSLGIGGLRRPKTVGLLLAWWGGIFGMAHPLLLGLPGAEVIGSFAFWIAIYLPMALLIGVGLAEPLISKLGSPGRWAGVALLGVLGVWGARDRMQEVDPFHYALLTRPDREAMAWIQTHLPPTARFLINGFLAYEGQDAVGSDGGWWLPLLARRAALIPPLPYAIERTKDPDLPAHLRTWISGLSSRDPRVLEDLIQRGWCYVYIGQRRGRINAPGPALWIPDELQRGPWEIVYHKDLIWIFKHRDCER